MKPRMHKGNVPMDSDFEKIGTVFQNKLEYGIFIKKSSSSGSWVNLKLVLLHGDKAQKANYWLAWSKIEDVFAKSRDHLIILEHCPKLLDELKSILRPIYETR